MKTFAVVHYAGSVVLPAQYVEVAERNPEAFARELPTDAVCFSYCDTPGLPDFSHNPQREYVERTNESPTYFLDAVLLNKQGVRELDLSDWHKGNLLWNLEHNGASYIVQSRVPHVYQIAKADAVVLSTV